MAPRPPCLPLIDLIVFRRLKGVGDTWPGDSSWSRTCDLSVKRSPESGGSWGGGGVENLCVGRSEDKESDQMASISHFVQLLTFIISVLCPVILT